MTSTTASALNARRFVADVPGSQLRAPAAGAFFAAITFIFQRLQLCMQAHEENVRDCSAASVSVRRHTGSALTRMTAILFTRKSAFAAHVR